MGKKGNNQQKQGLFTINTGLKDFGDGNSARNMVLGGCAIIAGTTIGIALKGLVTKGLNKLATATGSEPLFDAEGGSTGGSGDGDGNPKKAIGGLLKEAESDKGFGKGMAHKFAAAAGGTFVPNDSAPAPVEPKPNEG